MTKPLLNYCLVTQNLASIIEDYAYDSDRYPDISNIIGEVIFTPNIANGKAYQLFDRDGNTFTVPVSRIRAKIINGVITHEGETGIYLFAAGDGSNPDKITYSVEYRNLRTGDLSFSLSPLKFEAIPGGEVDLTMATPVVGATPAGVVRGPRGAGLESIVVDGSELVFTAADEVHSFEMSRIPLDEIVRAEADAAADGVRDRLSEDMTASQSARNAAKGHADRAHTSESNAKTSETNSKTSETNAGDYAAVATTAATEAVDAMKAAAESAAVFSIYTGTGSPEGKITAPVGSVYTDSAATNGAVRWVKTSGTGSAGWKVEYGDTALRNVTNLITNASGSLSLSRVGSTVFLQGRDITPTSDLTSGGTFVSTLPLGFRPMERRDFPLPHTLSSSNNRSAYQFVTGAIGVWLPSTSDKYHFQLSWQTADNWPTTLPGTPA